MQSKPSWQSYLMGQIISKDDFDFITKFDNASAEERTEILKNPEARLQFAKTFLTLMSSISKEHTVQYILTLLDNTLREDKSRVDILKSFARDKKENLLSYFFNMLTRPDPFVVHQTSRIIAKIACWSSVKMDASDLNYYLLWLKNQLNTRQNPYLQTACRCLQMILRIEDYRFAFMKISGFIQMIDVLNEPSIGFQIQYQICFCIWLLSFTRSIADIISTKLLIPRFCEIISGTQKEKVARIILMLLRNLLEKPSSEAYIKENSRALIACRFLKSLELLESKKFEDPDIVNDINFLKEKLEIGLEEVTSFDEYSFELRSGCLCWSPVHKSERFWHENVEKFNENNCEMLKLLLSLIVSSSDPLVLSVAVYDIGQYVRYYPRGKIMIQKLDGKNTIMNLLNHDDANVRYQALICIQKLMTHNWDFLGKQLESETKDEKGLYLKTHVKEVK